MKFEDFFERVVRTTDIRTQKQLADLLGVGPASITLSKTRGVPRSWSLRVASVFGINASWLETGHGPIYQGEGRDAFYVPKVCARACAGSGSLEVGDNIIGELPFSAAWISRKGSPRDMVVMEVVGDSMSPELEEGDSILVDQSQRRIQGSNVYVLGLDDSLQVKRVHVSPGLAVLVSANHRYAPVTLQGDELDTLRILGRVIWSSREYA